MIQTIKKTDEDIEREVALETYSVTAADLKKSIKLRAEILGQYDITVDTGSKTDTQIWEIVDKVREAINKLFRWNLPTIEELERSRKNSLAALALQYEEEELIMRERKIRDRYDRLPAIEKIQINLIKLRDLKIGQYSRPIFDLKFQSNDEETLLPIEYSLVITRVSLDDVLNSNEPHEFKVLRSLLENFFVEADLHLNRFDRLLESRKKIMKDEAQSENNQLSLSLNQDSDVTDGEG